MSDFVKVCSVKDVPVGQGKAVEVEGNQIAVFNIDGAFYAIDNVCRHRNGPLAEGDVEGTVVTCPWHGWTYDVTTGVSPDDPECVNACFEVKIEGDDILLGPARQ